MAKKNCLYLVLLSITWLSFKSDKIDPSFFQKQKQAIDSSIQKFQSAEKICLEKDYSNDFNPYAKNKYFVRNLKTEFGYIFSDH